MKTNYNRDEQPIMSVVTKRHHLCIARLALMTWTSLVSSVGQQTTTFLSSLELKTHLPAVREPSSPSTILLVSLQQPHSITGCGLHRHSACSRAGSERVPEKNEEPIQPNDSTSGYYFQSKRDNVAKILKQKYCHLYFSCLKGLITLLRPKT